MQLNQRKVVGKREKVMIIALHRISICVLYGTGDDGISILLGLVVCWCIRVEFFGCRSVCVGPGAAVLCWDGES